MVVTLRDKRDFQAGVIAVDAPTDVAVIKIRAKGLPKVAVGNPANLKVGEWVAAIGSPFGFDYSVTKGIVSAMGRALPDETYVPFIQTDAALNPGSSGGPLFNMKGEVIGINSQIYSRSGGFMGIAFAIPIDVAMDVEQAAGGERQGHPRPPRGRGPGDHSGARQIIQAQEGQRCARDCGRERRSGGQSRG